MSIPTAYLIGADGSGDHAVTHMSADQGSAQLPAWSPTAAASPSR